MSGYLAAVRIALRAILRSKLRAALTVLGILIGVSAVVIVVALGTGVRNRVLGEISGMGASSIYIFPQSTQASGLKRRENARMSEADGIAILKESTSVAALSPFSSTSTQVVAGEANVATQVMGVTRSSCRQPASRPRAAISRSAQLSPCGTDPWPGRPCVVRRTQSGTFSEGAYWNTCVFFGPMPASP